WGGTTATACPGTAIRAAISAGELEPQDDDEEDDVKQLVMWRHANYQNVWLIGTGNAVHLSPKLYAHYHALGVTTIVETHEQTLRSCLATSGVTADALVKV